MNIEETARLIAKGETKFSNLAQAFYKLNIFKYLESVCSDKSFLKAFGSIDDIKKKKYLEILKENLDLSGLPVIREKVKNFYEGVKRTYYVELVSARVGYRFVMGMGYSSPVENGFLLHHIYGIPYIPGESVKGLVRFMYIYRRLALENAKSEKEIKDIQQQVEKLEKGNYKEGELKEEEKLFIDLFGTQKEEGKVVFFDAFPVCLRKENLTIDVMNPHYGEYYREKGKKPPADWHNPNPVFFLALEDIDFVFYVGAKKYEEKKEKLLSEALKLLREGLEIYGLGAKRRKGYGWFEVHQQKEKTAKR